MKFRLRPIGDNANVEVSFDTSDVCDIVRTVENHENYTVVRFERSENEYIIVKVSAGGAETDINNIPFELGVVDGRYVVYLR